MMQAKEATDHAARRALLVGALALAVAAGLAGCSLFGGSSKTGGGSTVVGLSQVPWCDQPLLSFQDNGTTSQTTLTQWDQVRGQLGFNPYLPKSLPKGTCLVLAGGSIHDPIYGGHLSITYDVPGTGPLSFSEAPKRASLGDSLQCTTSAQDSKTVICLGTKGSTAITIAARESQSDVQALFNSLQSNVTWLPANTEKLLATATATATATTSGQ
jgi:hypothetical protein